MYSNITTFVKTSPQKRWFFALNLLQNTVVAHLRLRIASENVLVDWCPTNLKLSCNYGACLAIIMHGVWINRYDRSITIRLSLIIELQNRCRTKRAHVHWMLNKTLPSRNIFVILFRLSSRQNSCRVKCKCVLLMIAYLQD